MEESLLCVGVDIGTSTTQMVFSRLRLENRAASYTVPDFTIAEKEILYRSRIHMTPLRSASVIDAAAIRDIVDAEYRAAGMEKQKIRTGAVIITGETARKDNAAEVLQALSGYAGEFVVATAGPDLESVLAARGAGADVFAKRYDRAVIHIDIGGGTSNFATFDGEKMLDTGCLNVGGRLVKLREDGEVTYVSPVLDELCDLQIGDRPSQQQLSELAALLCRALEEAAGLRAPTALSRKLTTNKLARLPMSRPVISFSGGVGAMLEEAAQTQWNRHGDLGVLLARAIRRSALTAGEYRVCTDAIRATVIGAGMHSTELSGSTIFYEGIQFPIRDLPVLLVHADASAQQIAQAMKGFADGSGPQCVALALPGEENPTFARVCTLADTLLTALQEQLSRGEPAVIVTQADMAKALGHAMRARMEASQALLCLDGLAPGSGTYLDIGEPVAGGNALPVIMKTLLFSN